MAESMSAKRGKSMGAALRDRRRGGAGAVSATHEAQGSAAQGGDSGIEAFPTFRFYNMALTRFYTSNIIEVFHEN